MSEPGWMDGYVWIFLVLCVALMIVVANRSRRARFARSIELPTALERELGGWSARPDGVDVLPEYLEALAQACISPAVLRESPMRAGLMVLGAWRRNHQPEPHCCPSGHPLFRELGARGSVPPAVCEAAYQFFQQCTPFEAHALTLVLQCTLLHSKLSGDSSYALLHTLQGGLGLCRSAARLVVQRAVLSCVSRLLPSEGEALGGGSCGADGGQMKMTLETARARLFRLCSATVQDLKDAALRQAFVEPQLWLCALAASSSSDCARLHSLAADAEVHGEGVHAALLEAALGVRSSRLPELADGVIGVIDFHATLLRGRDRGDNSDSLGNGPYSAGFAALVSPENLGRPWNRVPACVAAIAAADASTSSALALSEEPDAFIFTSIREECSVRELADRAASPSSAVALRTRYASYLRIYTRLLGPEIVLPRLMAAVLGTSVRGSEEEGEKGLLPELQFVYEHLRAEDAQAAAMPPDATGSAPRALSSAERSAAIDCITAEAPSEVLMWLYDEDTGALNLGAALRLFAEVGVLAPQCSRRGLCNPGPGVRKGVLRTNATPPPILCGGWGGPGGLFFDDAALLGGASNIRRVVGLVICAGLAIDSVQVTYELRDGSVVTQPVRGGPGGTSQVVTLASDECIVGVFGRVGAWQPRGGLAGVHVDALGLLIMNGAGAQRTVGPFGSTEGGRAFSLVLPVSGCGDQRHIIAFVGRAGILLDALKVFVTPPSAAAVQMCAASAPNTSLSAPLSQANGQPQVDSIARRRRQI